MKAQINRKKLTPAKCMRLILDLCLAVTALLICMPVVLTIFASLKSGRELLDALYPILTENGETVHWKLLPLYPTLQHYIKLLFYTPQFFTVFWNSVKMAVCILTGQLFVAVPAAWAFAKFPFRGKKLLFTLYIILMLMPFQVMMLPSYLVLNGIGLMDTQMAVILPAIFSTFPVFLIYRGFTAVSSEIIEAAQMDGADDFHVFVKIGLPLGKSGILSAVVLSFLDVWNMIEQPMAFIKTKSLWPMSLYLPEIDASEAGVALASAVMALIPAAFVFVIGQDYLEQGIIASGLKE